MLTPTSASKIQKINNPTQTVYNVLSGDNSSFDASSTPRAVSLPRVQAGVSAGRFSLHHNRGFQTLQARAAASQPR